MLFSQFADRIRSEVRRTAQGPGVTDRTSVSWKSSKSPIGGPVSIELSVVQNRETYGEPRWTSDADGAVRVWHSQRTYRVLCTVYSIAPAVQGSDRGAAYVQTAQEILERIQVRLNSLATWTALGPGACEYQDYGDIIAVDVVRDGKAWDTASSELVFAVAGDDSEASEGAGAIERLELTSELKNPDGTDAPGPWDAHAVPEDS